MLCCEYNASGWAVDYYAGLVRLRVAYQPVLEDTQRSCEFFILTSFDVARLLFDQPVVLGAATLRLERPKGGRHGDAERDCLVVREKDRVFTYVFDEFTWSRLHDALECAVRESEEIKTVDRIVTIR